MEHTDVRGVAGIQLKMRVLHVVTVPLSLLFLRGQIGFLKRRGVEFAAVSSPGPELDEFARREQVPTHAIPMARAITPFRDLVAVFQLARTIRNCNPDIVHAHTPKGGLLGMLAATLARTPVRIYHMRGLPFETATGPRRALLWCSEFVSCSLAHRVFCVGYGLRDVAIASGVCPSRKIEVFGGGSGNGVDAAGRFAPPEDDRLRRAKRAQLGVAEDAVVVGFVGRVVRDKGVAELTMAWRRIREAHANCHLVIIGPEEPRDALPRSLIEELSRDPRVHLVGAVSDPEAWYPVFDVVALPTYREGFPNVLLEAAAMGLPVVATDIPGCREAVRDGVTGKLVPRMDDAALAEALLEYVSSPERRHAHGIAGRRRVLDRFAPEKIWAEIHSAYEAQLRRARTRGRRSPAPSQANS